MQNPIRMPIINDNPTKEELDEVMQALANLKDDMEHLRYDAKE